MMKSILLVVAILCLCQSQTPALDTMVFPGWPAYKFKTYSGYLNVTADRQYHYVFLESANAPATDPVVLWLNGGPGCSSMLGLLTEVGPFIFDDQPPFNLKADDGFGWNSKANMLFLESPAGVGFSTIAVNSTYVYNDTNTGSDNQQALQAFFARFTTFQANSFFISGESYGGMYIPYTAKAILDGNAVKTNIQVNLKGVLIGNGVISGDRELRDNASLQYFVNRNLFDYKTKFILQNQCKTQPNSQSCQQAQATFNNVIKDLNVYNIYGYCYNVEAVSNEPRSDAFKFKYPQTTWLPFANYKAGGPPCTNAGPSETYLNANATQTAMRVNNTWEMCNMAINENYYQSPQGSSFILPLLHQAGVRVLLYSGDQDAAVCVQETIDSITAMNLTQTQAWTPFADEDNVVVGWKVKYDVLDLTIVRGAGHMVPSDQRKVAYSMFNTFISASKEENILLQE